VDQSKESQWKFHFTDEKPLFSIKNGAIQDMNLYTLSNRKIFYKEGNLYYQLKKQNEDPTHCLG